MQKNPSTATANVTPALLSAVCDKLSDLAKTGPGARDCYEAIIELVAIHDGDLPSAARLVHLVNLFNSHRDADVPGVPLGSANVATECVANYRRSLLQARQNPVAHPGLPADMAATMNRWLERLMQTMSRRLEATFQAQAEVQNQLHQKAIEDAKAAHITEVASMLHDIEGLQQEKAALESRVQGVAEERDHLKSLYEKMSQRNQDLIVMLEQKNTELRVKDRMEKDLASKVDTLKATTDNLRQEIANNRTELAMKEESLANALAQAHNAGLNLQQTQQALEHERQAVEELKHRFVTLQSELNTAAAQAHLSQKRSKPSAIGRSRVGAGMVARVLSKPSSARKQNRKEGR